MKKFVSMVLVLLLFSALLSGCGKTVSDSSNPAPKSPDKVFAIGISQFVEHPALDSAREGIIEGLKESGFLEGKDFTLDYQNAQTDFPTTQTIAEKFVSAKVDLIVAIATPSAQAAANATKGIPIVITAVTDPVEAGLVKSAEKSGTNVAGTSDMNPVKEQLELIKEFLPDAKNVGIIYNAAEPNSVVQVDIAKACAKDLGIDIIEATVANTSEVNLAAKTLIGKVDAIYAPTDNAVASSISAILKVANEAKIPVIPGERALVDAGALATFGIDYFSLGKQTGKIAARILEGEKPSEMAIEFSDDLKLVVNKKAADILGINIPESVLKRAAEVIQ